MTLFLQMVRAIFVLVVAPDTLASLPALDPCVETLAILLLALSLFTVTPLALAYLFRLDQFLGLVHDLLKLLMVVAPVTGTFGSAQLPRGEALTVHFQTVCLLTSTSCLLSLL